MNKLFTISMLLLTGCACWKSKPEEPAPEPKVVVIDNPQKDIYIQKLEAEIKETASALFVINDSREIKNPATKELLNAQIARLSKTAQPDANRVADLGKMVKENDIKAIKAEEAKADADAKNAQATKELLVKKDKEIDDKKLALEVKAKEVQELNDKSARLVKDKVLWMLSCLGAGLSVIGLGIAIFTPFNTKGLFVFAGGLVFASSAWVLDSKYMDWAVAVTLAICVADVGYLLTKKVYGSFTKSNSV